MEYKRDDLRSEHSYSKHESARLRLIEELRGKEVGDVEYMAYADYAAFRACEIQYLQTRSKGRKYALADASLYEEAGLFDFRLARQTIMQRKSAIPDYDKKIGVFSGIFSDFIEANKDKAGPSWGKPFNEVDFMAQAYFDFTNGTVIMQDGEVVSIGKKTGIGRV